MTRFNTRLGRLPGERTAYEMSVRLQAVRRTAFPVGLLDTITPDLIQEIRVPDDEIPFRPAQATEVAR